MRLVNSITDTISLHADFMLYLLKCVIGTIAGYYIYQAYPEAGAWSLVSIVLVLSPNRDDAVKLALNRIYANLVGAGTGLALFYIHATNLLTLSIGVIMVVVICRLLNLKEAARSAAVAVIIILLHEQGKHFWDVAISRAIGVVGGCLIAMLITYVVHLLWAKAPIVKHI